MSEPDNDNRTFEQELEIRGLTVEQMLKIRGIEYAAWRRRWLDSAIALAILVAFLALVGIVLMLAPNTAPGAHQGGTEGVPIDGQQD